MSFSVLFVCVLVGVLVGAVAALDLRAPRREAIGLWVAVILGGTVGALAAYGLIVLVTGR